MFPQYLSNVKEALLAESRCLDTIVVLMLIQFNSYDYPGIDGTLYAEVPGLQRWSKRSCAQSFRRPGVKIRTLFNFQSNFCGTMIEIRCLYSFHRRFNDYRSFSVKESVLLYWCKALCVPRHPAILRGAFHHKHNHHHQNHNRSHIDHCNQSYFCFYHL